MAHRFGFVTAAHGHGESYARAISARPDANVAGIWDHDLARAEAFAQASGAPIYADLAEMARDVDAFVVVSENRRHAEHIEAIAPSGKPILCEKPIATSEEEAERIERAVQAGGNQFMTAFPCRFSPAYQRLKERVRAGEIGAVRAIAATNRGSCPFDWFVEVEKSGGGALTDHLVHVTDLLHDLLQTDPETIFAKTGNNMYGEAWEDTAMASLQFPGGVFATIDSSWSRPRGFKTWGDVTMTVVGDGGVIEMDMFGQYIQQYRDGSPSHTVQSYGGDFDTLMIDEFVRAITEDREPTVTLRDGLQASRAVFAGYASVATGEPERFLT